MKSWNWSKLMTRIKGASFDITEEGFQSDTFQITLLANQNKARELLANQRARTEHQFEYSSKNMNFEPDSICAIMIPNSEPFSFIVAYFGCLFSRVKPLPIELPITNSRNGLTARFGTLLRKRFSQTSNTYQTRYQTRYQIRNRKII